MTTYQGSACKHGHDGKRYLRGGGCVACQAARNAAAAATGKHLIPRDQWKPRGRKPVSLEHAEQVKRAAHQRRKAARMACQVYVAPHGAVAPDRIEGRRGGYAWYHGEPCKFGHDPVRRVLTNECRECRRLSMVLKRQLADTEEKARERERKRRYPQDPEVKRQRAVAYRARLNATPEAELRRERQALARLAGRLGRAMKAAHDKAARAQAAAERAAERAAMIADPTHRAQVAERRTINNRMKASRRRALKRGLNGEKAATVAETHALLEAQAGRCAYCGSPDTLHLDHRHPVRLGGTHELANLQWLCAAHNMAKRITPDEEYRQLLGIPRLTPWDGWQGRAIWLAIMSA